MAQCQISYKELREGSGNGTFFSIYNKTEIKVQSLTKPLLLASSRYIGLMARLSRRQYKGAD